MRERTAEERRAYQTRALPCILGIALLSAAGTDPAAAAEFEIGELRGQVDTTLSVGVSMRVHNRNCKLIDPGNDEGCADPLNGFSNSDDGNLNYDKWDVFSNTYKATVDLDLAWRNFGGFFRGSAFYDFVTMDTNTERTPLDRDARYRSSPLNSGVVGTGFQLLDAYVYGDFDVAGRPFDVRIGNQVLSWGESLFFQRGVSSINTVDLNRLRAPGSLLKEAFLPAPMVRVSTEIFPNFGIEAFYQMYWNRTELDPAGSYFTDNVFQQDTVGRAAEGIFFGPDPEVLGKDAEETFEEYFYVPPVIVPLVPPTGNPEADFLIQTSIDLGFPPNAEVFAPFPEGIPRLGDVKPRSQGQWGVALRYFAEAIRTEFGLYYLRIHDKNPSVGFETDIVPGQPVTATFLQVESFAPSMQFIIPTDPVDARLTPVPVGYFREYPEDINIYGVSAATELFGIAWGAEISYTTRLPVSTGQSPLIEALENQKVGRFSGFVREKKLQAQLNAIATIGPGDPYVGAIVRLLRISSVAVTFEVAAVEFPSLDDDVAYEPPATKSHVDELSWGYQTLVQGFYDNPFGVPVTVTPRLGFTHDVDGNTPGRYPFIEDRKAFTAGVEVDYLGVWQFDMSYTNWYGAGLANGIHDRDWVSMSLTRSF
jgi:hypothetical protein